jgi:putative exosortase-associated protein (TIGR04073 family)
MAALALGSLLSAGLFAEPAFAQPYDAPRKTGRALGAIALGVLEIPGHVAKGMREESIVYGATVGLAKGLGATVVRELVGVYELLTFPFAVPRGFEPLIRPEFPWNHFDAPPPTR